MSQTNNGKKRCDIPEVVIVGGGMVGISLALLLEQSDISCSITLIEQNTIYERDSDCLWQPSFDDRSTALSATSAAIFQNLGLWEKLSPQVAAIQSVHVSDKGHFGGLTLNSKSYDIPALGYVVPNRWMGRVLIQHLRNQAITVMAPAKTLSARALKGGYEVIVKTENHQYTLNPNLLVIADGADSPLRKSLGIDTETHSYRQTALVMNITLQQPLKSTAYERFTSTGPLALLPLPDWEGQHRGAVVWTVRNPEAIKSLSNDELLLKLQKTFGYRAGIILAVGKCSTYPLFLVESREQVRSHLVVIGNAAHSIHPVAGQGFNLALRDCQSLVTVLQTTEAQQPFGSLAQLTTYLNRQIGDQRLTICLTDHLVKLFSNQSLLYAMARELGFLGINLLSPVNRKFGQLMMGAR